MTEEKVEGSNDELGVMTLGELAHELGTNRRQVWTWWNRRERNGFPESCGEITECKDKRRVGAKVFFLDEVQTWYEGYVPSKGGAALGNTNGRGNAGNRRPRKSVASD